METTQQRNFLVERPFSTVVNMLNLLTVNLDILSGGLQRATLALNLCVMSRRLPPATPPLNLPLAIDLEYAGCFHRNRDCGSLSMVSVGSCQSLLN